MTNEERKRIRHVAPAAAGNVVAVAQYRRHVQIWDTKAPYKIAILDTALDFGGRRLAVTQAGHHCIAGSYDENGLACYDVRTGEEIWRRRDLNTPQKVRVSKDDQYVYCGCEDKPLHVLSVADGNTASTLNGTDDIWESPFDRVRVHELRGEPFRILSDKGEMIGKLKPKRSAALDAVFAPGIFCLSESTGPISCYDVSSQRELWAHSFSDGTHAINLGYARDSGHITAVAREYKRTGESEGLVFDVQTGEVVASYPLPPAEYAFLPVGDRLMSSSGAILNSVNGDQISECQFFPDPAG